MTDNEIIKALECCVFKTIDKCDKCILTRHGNDCKKLGVYALDLINQQKAEITGLQNKICEVKEIINMIYGFKFDKVLLFRALEKTSMKSDTVNEVFEELAMVGESID